MKWKCKCGIFDDMCDVLDRVNGSGQYYRDHPNEPVVFKGIPKDEYPTCRVCRTAFKVDMNPEYIKAAAEVIKTCRKTNDASAC